MMNNVEMNKQAKLSEHMTLGELTKTKHVTADQAVREWERGGDGAKREVPEVGKGDLVSELVN